MKDIFSNKEIIEAGDKVFLSDIIKSTHYDVMFDRRLTPISFLDKGRCGNGGTTGIIRYCLENKRGAIILVPNVAIVKSKEVQFKKEVDEGVIGCLYQGSSESPKCQILISTYDQLTYALKKDSGCGLVCGEDIFDIKIWEGRTIVVDEYHKLVQDSGYRDICVKIIKYICQRKNPTIFLSATPDESLKEIINSNLLCERTFLEWVIKYPIEERNQHTVKIWDVKRTNILKVLKVMEDDGKEVNENGICVFYNALEECKKLAIQLGTDRCEILCSAQKKDDVGKLYSDHFNKEKMFHFMTSAYFTGMDIYTDVGNVIIVGSQKKDFMSYGVNDIIQILGRFRTNGDEKGSIRLGHNHIFWLDEKKDEKNFAPVLNRFEETEILCKSMTDVEHLVERSRLKQTLDNFRIWVSREELGKELEKTGKFKTEVRTKGELMKRIGKEYPKKKMWSFTKVKKLVQKGVKVPIDMYPDIFMLEEYMRVKGTKALKNARKEDIQNWYTVWLLTKDNLKDIDEVMYYKDELRKMFEIKDYYVYKYGYLQSVLDYLGVDYDKDQLHLKFSEVFDVYCVPWDVYSNRTHRNRLEFIVFTCNDLKLGKMQFGGFFSNDIIIRDNTKKTPQIALSPEKVKEQLTDIKLSYDTQKSDHNNYATSKTLKEIVVQDRIKSVDTTGIEYKSEKWTKLKTFRQTMLSDLYSDKFRYRYNLESMEKIDCLMLDIDEGISYNDFAEKYKDFTYLSYPSISQRVIEDDNWKKYRVLFPLTHTLNIYGEYKLRVVKSLRHMFCMYEDPAHQMYSFVNKEDFMKQRVNIGEVLDIPQELVDKLTKAYENHKVFKNEMFNKLNVDISNLPTKSLEWGIEKFRSIPKNAPSGTWYDTMFVIKNRLREEDRDKMEKWLGENYGRRTVEGWRKNSIKRR